MSIYEEIQRRRTFAIISHPDAGKTTLTEKLLLYGGAVQLAGSVTARKNQRATTSDWMELEKKRGISISSTVLQFDYDGYRINLLDTPGHKDFSEDTYRVLTAVDAVVMVIDSAKGIEPQTRKLFEVCRQRGVPIFTFMNKCDRPMKESAGAARRTGARARHRRVSGELADRQRLRISKACIDRQTKLMHLFERTVGGQLSRAGVEVGGLHDPKSFAASLDEATFHKTVEELEMLEHAGEILMTPPCWPAKRTPVFFGSGEQQFRRAAFARRFSETFARAQIARDGRHRNCPGKSGVLRFHFQDPGEHGSAAPRPHRLHPRLLRQI